MCNCWTCWVGVFVDKLCQANLCTFEEKRIADSLLRDMLTMDDSYFEINKYIEGLEGVPIV